MAGIGGGAKSTFLAIVKGDASQAITEFKKLGATTSKVTSGAGADMSKWKKLTSGAMDQVKANAGALAVGAGTALVAFGIKAVHAFEETAKAAINLGKATGLSTEAASRWIAVGDDFQVSADQLQAGLGKIGKTLDGAQWDKYGIATRDAGGNARDTNDILLDALSTLSGIKNETERARVGNELFGKGYANLAPLIGHTRDEYQKMLGSVEKGQVITEREAAKAERMRLAEDALGDAIKEVTLIVGEAVAGLAPYLETLTKIVALIDKLPPGVLEGLMFPVPAGGDISKTEDWANATIKAALATSDAIGYLKQRGFTQKGAERAIADYNAELAKQKQAEKDVTEATGGTTDAIHGAGEAARDSAAAALKLSGGLDMAATKAALLAEAEKRVEDNSRKVERAWADLFGVLDEEQSVADMQQQFDDLASAAKAAWDAAAKGEADAADKQKAYQQEIRNTKREIATYAQDILNISPERTTKLIALVDEGKAAEAKSYLDRLTANRTMMISIQTQAAGTGFAGVATSAIVSQVSKNIKARAGGGPVQAGQPYVVGEKRPELFVPNQNGRILPNVGGGATINNYVNVTAGMGANGPQLGRQIAEELEKVYRSGSRNYSWMAA